MSEFLTFKMEIPSVPANSQQVQSQHKKNIKILKIKGINALKVSQQRQGEYYNCEVKGITAFQSVCWPDSSNTLLTCANNVHNATVCQFTVQKQSTNTMRSTIQIQLQSSLHIAYTPIDLLFSLTRIKRSFNCSFYVNFLLWFKVEQLFYVI